MTTDERIEKVARAIADAWGLEWDDVPYYTAPEYESPDKQDIRRAAKAAISADDSALAKENAEQAIIEGLLKLTDDERLLIFSKFCTSCGDHNPKCQCWNDE